MIEIQLIQGTAEWLEWRKGVELKDGPRITATAASVAGGRSIFATPHQLWEEMTGQKSPKDATFAMRHGQRTEPKARNAYMRYVGEEYEPVCIQSSNDPWIAASLDGLDILRTRGVEIKCPVQPGNHQKAMNGEVPDYYYDQIQWQLLASDGQIAEIDYFSYMPEVGNAKPITVKADPQRQNELKQAAERFRLAVLTGIPLAGSAFETAANQFCIINRMVKQMTERLEEAKNNLKKLIVDDKTTTAGGAMVIVSMNDGRVNNEAVINSLAEKCGITPEELDALKKSKRSAPTKVVTIKETSEAEAIWQAHLAKQQVTTSVVTITQGCDEQEQVVSPLW